MADLIVLNEPLSGRTFALADDEARVVILGQAALESFDTAMLERLTTRRTLVIATTGSDLRGKALGAALHCDWLAMPESASLELSFEDAGILSGLFWRAPVSVRKLYLDSSRVLPSKEAHRLGLADALVPDGVDSVKWVVSWIGERNLLALQAGARLIRHASEPLERAEFARLFAAGQPQEGLAAFLEKRKPNWNKEG